MRRAGLSGFCLALGLLAGPCASADDALQRIAERGLLRVCQPIESPPFAYHDASGRQVGILFELSEDLARRLAEHFGKPVRLELVRHTPTNRLEFIRGGRCDLMYLLGHDRSKIRADFAEPAVLRTGSVFIAPKSYRIAGWEELRGRKVCGMVSSPWATLYERRYGIRYVSYGGHLESLKAIEDGRCVGLQASARVYEALRQDNQHWGQNMEAKFPPQDELDYGLALRQGQPALKAFVSEVVGQWHRSGLILDLYRKHGQTPDAWLRSMHDSR
ncbi:transporter substrate-binding domain-containing protein [Pseudomonas sp. LRF_L74]|uniref:transporter substrate-binding domain-containing protein n=1 Tax=Pseudomonas sp. LRF_L74 TaxID=3369422 RepID=UPI003F63F799